MFGKFVSSLITRNVPMAGNPLEENHPVNTNKAINFMFCFLHMLGVAIWKEKKERIAD